MKTLASILALLFFTIGVLPGASYFGRSVSTLPSIVIAPPAPPPKPAPVVPPPAVKTHVLTVGQYLHVKHSEAVIKAEDAAFFGNVAERSRWLSTAYLYENLASKTGPFFDVLDEPYIGDL